jgi:hypothetical protein
MACRPRTEPTRLYVRARLAELSLEPVGNTQISRVGFIRRHRERCSAAEAAAPSLGVKIIALGMHTGDAPGGRQVDCKGVSSETRASCVLPCPLA